MGGGGSTMPLTRFQKEIAKLLAVNRTPDSHLAGGAALNFSPNSKRFSNDLDFFHDSVERVVEAFEKDRETLATRAYAVIIEIRQQGYIRAAVTKAHEETKIEWSHDSAWRFLPAILTKDSGYLLHPLDVAVNKVLALAGRDEARDFLDVIYINREILPLGPLCWAAVGKDPGFNPRSLLELLKRRGKYRGEDFTSLMLRKPVDLQDLKSEWLAMLDAAEQFIRVQLHDEVGCLYYSPDRRSFVDPQSLDGAEAENVVRHFCCPGGVLPRLYQGDFLAERLGSF